MGCQSSCNWGVQHVQLHGQVASITENVNNSVFSALGRGSSRNTVQFLTEIDRNHECQLRKSLERNFIFLNIGLIINATAKKCM